MKGLAIRALQTNFLWRITAQKKRVEETDFQGWFINRTESHLELSVRHGSGLYVHHLVDFHTWELASATDLLRVTETSHRITHSFLPTFHLAHKLTPAASWSMNLLLLPASFICRCVTNLWFHTDSLWVWNQFTGDTFHILSMSAIVFFFFFSLALALFISEIDCGVNAVLCSATKTKTSY